MTSFVRLHHVRLEAFVDFVVELLRWVDGVVVVVLDQRVARRMRQRADVVAGVVDVREIVALLVAADAVRQRPVDRLLLCASCWCVRRVPFLRRCRRRRQIHWKFHKIIEKFSENVKIKLTRRRLPTLIARDRMRRSTGDGTRTRSAARLPSILRRTRA